MDWLKDMCERARNADGWIDGEFPTEAAEALASVEDWGGAIMLCHLLIDRVNEMQAIVGAVKGRGGETCDWSGSWDAMRESILAEPDQPSAIINWALSCVDAFDPREQKSEEVK